MWQNSSNVVAARPRVTLAIVAAGIALAALLAALVNHLSPEHETKIATIANVSSIDFMALESGANLADLERGRVYFAQLCVSCHGVYGDGDGEWAYRVTPHPIDLTSAWVQQRSDDYLFDIVSNGEVGTSMKGWKQQLSARQRWQIVAYLRHLGAQEMRRARIDS